MLPPAVPVPVLSEAVGLATQFGWKDEQKEDCGEKEWTEKNLFGGRQPSLLYYSKRDQSKLEDISGEQEIRT